MYKIETHLHTKLVSGCGWLTPEEIITGYKEKGYDALVVTDHFHREWLEGVEMIRGKGFDIAEEYLKGYEAVREEGKKEGIRVYYGAELRFEENDSDYILLGFERDLLYDAEKIFRMGICRFSRIAEEKGLVIIQAHPFRKGSVQADPKCIDGVETYNANIRHLNNNHNEMALEFAQKNNLLMMAGSDCHRPEDIGVSGILSDILPADSFAYAQLIKSGNYSHIID